MRYELLTGHSMGKRWTTNMVIRNYVNKNIFIFTTTPRTTVATPIRVGRKEEESPWQQIAIRELEEAS